MAVHVAKALIEHGKVVRGWLGVSIRDLSPGQVKSMKRKDNKGALIAEVVPGSPAEKAGLKKDDLVVRVQGVAIEDAAALQRSVADTPVGDTAGLTVLRDGKPVDLKVTIGSMDEAMRQIAASLEDRLGVIVRPLTSDETREYGLNPGRGVAIASVDKDGPLEEVGFENDDIILDINNTPVRGVEGFAALIKALPPHQQILINAVDHRTGQSGFVQVNIG
jgi:serine protease Do